MAKTIGEKSTTTAALDRLIGDRDKKNAGKTTDEYINNLEKAINNAENEDKNIEKTKNESEEKNKDEKKTKIDNKVKADEKLNEEYINFTGLLDLGQNGIEFRIKQKPRGTIREKGTGRAEAVLTAKEFEHFNELKRKYNLNTSQLIKTLIVNAR